MIKTRFRLFSKIIAAASEAVGKPLTMCKILNVNKFWKTLKDLGTFRMRTNLFYFKAVSLEFLKALGIMASQVLKHLQETAGDPKLINNVKTFQIHRNQYWNQDVGKKLSVEKKILKFNQELVKSKKSLMQESATAL